MSVVAGTRRIELADVAALGNVDDALAGFYVDQVNTAATASGVPVRLVREWIEDQLVTAQGFRTQVLDGPGTNGRVVLRMLEDGHLLRSESRRGAQWYEIAHDRLVSPILEANAAWRTEHLHPLQIDARAWERADRAPSLLVGGEALASAVAWAADHPDDLVAVDREYLDACRAAQSQHEAMARAARRNRILAIASSALALVAVAGLIVALLSWREAARQRDAADGATRQAVAAEARATGALDDAVRSAAEAKANADEAGRQRADADAQRAIAEAKSDEADRNAADADVQRRRAEEAQQRAELGQLAAEQNAREAEANAAKAERARAEAAAAAKVADSERLGLLASGQAPGDVDLAAMLALEAHEAASTALERKALFDVARAIGTTRLRLTTFENPFSGTDALAPTGRWAAIVGGVMAASSTVQVYDEPPSFGLVRTTRTFPYGSVPVAQVAFSPSGALLAVVALDRSQCAAVLADPGVPDCTGSPARVDVFDVATGDLRATVADLVFLQDQELAFSADGRWLVAGATLVDLRNGARRALLGRPATTGDVGALRVAFQPGGAALAYSQRSKAEVAIVDLPDGPAAGDARVLPLTLRASTPAAGARPTAGPVAMSASAVATAVDGTVEVLELTRGRTVCSVRPIGGALELLFSADGRSLFTISPTIGIQAWDVAPGAASTCRLVGDVGGAVDLEAGPIVLSTDGTLLLVRRSRGFDTIPTLDGATDQQLVARLAERVATSKRSLTPAERAAYRVPD